MPHYYPIDRLSVLVESVRGLPNQIRFERRGQNRGHTSLDHINHCLQALLSGALPDAETLLFVATAFYRYVHSEGALSLDQAFRLRSKPKAGNPARQAAQQRKIGDEAGLDRSKRRLTCGGSEAEEREESRP